MIGLKSSSFNSLAASLYELDFRSKSEISFHAHIWTSDYEMAPNFFIIKETKMQGKLFRNPRKNNMQKRAAICACLTLEKYSFGWLLSYHASHEIINKTFFLCFASNIYFTCRLQRKEIRTVIFRRTNFLLTVSGKRSC